jgi:molybdopterin/thiamine biosynthesis adenylyltransferase/molybdopterin synthase catalytic subunit/rhodanese-related sulfurtransferase
MTRFSFSRTAIDVSSVRAELADPACGGYTSFEGLVRNHNEGLNVQHLEYEAFEPLAVKEGERIIAEAIERFGIEHAACVHRIGDLAIGDMAVYVGASARHRDEAFRACRYIIDEVKHRVPIWKKEHYENGDSGWVNCERCAAPTQDQGQFATHEHGRDHGHQHSAAHSHAHDHEHSAAANDHQHSAPAPIPDYSRQMALKEVGPQGQGKLRASRVLVIGCGGLGVPVISYLAGAGIGRLGLVDADRLEASNLHRQTMYALAEVGELKAELAAARVRALNPDVDVRTYPVRLDATTAPDMIGEYDLVIDCTDNFSTKFLLNDLCVQKRVPVIFSSVYQYEGQIQVVRPDKDGICLRCVWPEATRDGIVGNCSEAGVLGPVPGTFGSLQAFEALKLLLDLPGQLGDEVLVLDLLTMSSSRVRAKRTATHPAHALTSPALTQAQAHAQAADTTPLEMDFASLEEARAAGFEIIDIREPQELEEIPTPTRNARHIPMAQLLHGNPAFTPNGKTLLVCASGRRSLAATQELRSRGAKAIYSLRGGVTKLNRRHVPA